MPATTTKQKQTPELPDGVISLLRSGKGGKTTRRFVKALKGKTPETQWSEWVAHLRQRGKPQPIGKLTKGSTSSSPLLWAIDEAGLADHETVELIQRLAKLKPLRRAESDSELSQVLAFWLAEADARPLDCAYAFQSLAWAHAMPALAARVPAPLWCELLSHLTETAQQAQPTRASDEPLVHQLLAGELPLTMHYQLPELAACQPLPPTAQGSLSDGLDQLLDGAGLPHRRHLPLLRPLLACWTRANLLASRSKAVKFNSAAQTQYAYVLEQALRLTRTDATQTFADPQSRHTLPLDMVRTALTLIDDNDCVALARQIFPKKLIPVPGPSPEPPDCPSGNSEWAGLAVLRANWSSASPRLAVAYSDRNVETELTCGRTVIWSGRCQPTVEIDGAALQPSSDWAEVCWFSDDDVDYLELEIALEKGWRIQRQMCLAREDNFLFLADAVLGNTSAPIRYRGNWPLRPGIRFQEQDETCDGFLSGRKRLGLVLPLALPEWRTDRRIGHLRAVADGLELQQSAEGKALYAPLLIDLDPSRLGKTATWRQLTVAERLEIVSADTAVGYRVLLGRDQWMIYRSLAAPSSRTLLGQHVAAECIIARFDEEGEADPMVEVETE